MTEFNDGTPESAEVTDLREAPAPEETPKPRFTRRQIGLAITGGVVTLGVLAAGIATAGGSGTIEVTGSITVMEQCSDIDEGGYSDMHAGQDVVIKDEDGTTIAVGDLGPALREMSTCEFEFTVSDVPTDAKFYEVEISHRGAMRYTLAELKQPLGLQLGD